MKGWIEEYAILRKFIEKYCEEQDKNRLIEILNMKDRFLFKYFVNEFSKLKIPNKMTEEELKEYRKFCAKKGISISYSRKGNPYDNACIESFHATLKKEYVHNENFENLESLRSGMYEYIEIWYNNSRIHSKIGFTSPNEYEESIKKGNKEIA